MLKTVGQRGPIRQHALRSHDSAKFEHVSTSTQHDLVLWQVILRNVRNVPVPSSSIDEVCLCIAGSSDLAQRRTPMKTLSLWMIAAACFLAPASMAYAHSAYDGSWELAFVTKIGVCDPSYNFTVNISDGIVTHPNLVRFKGYVARSGSVRASVTVQDKFASGTGKLSGTSGRGRWNGHAGSGRCSGYWTAQRN
jgi:hypothetical protein